MYVKILTRAKEFTENIKKCPYSPRFGTCDTHSNPE